MAQLTYSDKFTNVKKYDEVTGTYTGIQIASKLNQKNGQDYKLLDAIDIDWDGVWISQLNTYVHTTDDLITAIDTIADLGDLEWIKENINTLNEEVDTILSTYVTQDQLAEILAHYQKPITAGEHIIINEENEISTYDLLTPGEADAKFALIEDLDNVIARLDNDYYTKFYADLQAYNIAFDTIQNTIVLNADEQFDNLEKVSDFLSALPLDDINNIAELADRVNRLDDTVGFAYYHEETDTYTYTGLLQRTYDLETDTANIHHELFVMNQDIQFAMTTAYEAENIAYEAYDMAYTAYTASGQADEMARQAYEMAYDATVKVGIPHSYGYFIELTEDDITLLNEDKYALEVYSIKEDNESGIPLPDVYNPNSGLQYYIYVPEVEATGFYKALDEVTDLSYAAKYSADTALFRLYTRTEGSTYANLRIDPALSENIDNTRTITLELDEADIDELSGYINKDGIITTYSLVEAFSYAFRPEFITNDPENSEIEVIEGDENDNNG